MALGCVRVSLLLAATLWSGGIYAQVAGTLPAYSAGSGIVPNAGSRVITWDAVNQTGGIAVNSLVGADRFYAAGIFGQQTFTANVEAGAIWNGHETTSTLNDYYTAPGATGEFDWHATAVGSVLVGYNPNADPYNYPYYQLGMAPLTTLSSGAMATNWYVGADQNAYFNLTAKTFYSAYNNYFTQPQWHTVSFYGITLSYQGPTDVINSSWGYDDPTATDPFTMAADGLARANPHTTFVVAAGNSTTAGNPSNNVGGPASGYNCIAVGAVGDYSAANFTGVADFSSRGPQDYYDPVHGTVHGVRAPVALVAPGTSIVAAYYGGQTGSNGISLSTTVPDQSGGANDWYALGAAGTSFAAPIVSGGVSLLTSASYINGMGSESRDARVIKAVLMNSATKLPGWNNGQAPNAAGVVVTTQAVDWAQGAGMLNLDRAYDQYLSGTQDVPGAIGGPVLALGWDYGTLSKDPNPAITSHNDYPIRGSLKAGTVMDVTLAWFRDLGVPVFTDNANPDLQTLTTVDQGFANLDLEVWDSSFQHLYASSESLYNDVQELRLTLPIDGQYGIRVTYAGQMFGTPQQEAYGLAWSAPEPGTWVLLLVFAAGLAGWGLFCSRRPLASGEPQDL